MGQPLSTLSKSFTTALHSAMGKDENGNNTGGEQHQPHQLNSTLMQLLGAEDSNDMGGEQQPHQLNSTLMQLLGAEDGNNTGGGQQQPQLNNALLQQLLGDDVGEDSGGAHMVLDVEGGGPLVSPAAMRPRTQNPGLSSLFGSHGRADDEGESPHQRPSHAGVVSGVLKSSSIPSRAGGGVSDAGAAAKPARKLMIVTPSQTVVQMAGGLGQVEPLRGSKGGGGTRFSEPGGGGAGSGRRPPTKNASSGHIRFNTGGGDEDKEAVNDSTRGVSRQNSVRSVLKTSTSRRSHTNDEGDSDDDEDAHTGAGSRRASRVNFGGEDIHVPASRAQSQQRIRFQVWAGGEGGIR